MESISSSLHIASPFYFLLLIPFFVFFFPLANRKPRISIPDRSIVSSSVFFSDLLRRISIALLSVLAVCLIIVLVSPGVQEIHERPVRFSQNTRDIAVVFDVSGSMGGSGKESPFSLARDTLQSFCAGRSGDRFTLAVFSHKGAYSASPLSSDCNQISFLLEGDLSDKTSLVSQFSGGTNIASALAAVPSILEDSSSSKIALLVSDMGHGGSITEVTDTISYLVGRGIKVYIWAINVDTKKAAVINEYAGSSPHVKMFDINDPLDFARVHETMDALEPSSAPMFITEEVSVNNANGLFLILALGALILWAMVQVLMRRIT